MQRRPGYDLYCIVRHWKSLVSGRKRIQTISPRRVTGEVRGKHFAGPQRVTSPGMSHFCGLLPAAAHELERLR